MLITHTFSNPAAQATGTLTVWAGSTTATVAASGVAGPDAWNANHGLVQQLAGNTAGVSSISGSNIVIAGGSNVTLSGAQGANGGTFSVIGGTGEVGTGTTFGGTNISGSMTLNSAGLALSLSGGAGGGAGSLTVSAGTASAALDLVVFSNSNRVSFGLDGSTITASINARSSNDGIGLNTAQTNVTWTVNSSGLSLNAAGYAGTGTTFGGTNISGSITQNSNGIALSLSGLAALTSQSNQALSAANGSFTFQTASFSNVNGVSFATSAGSAIAANFGGPTLALTNLSGTTSSNSAGHTLSLSAAAGGAGGGNTVSYFGHLTNASQAAFNATRIEQSTSAIIPFNVPNISFDFLRLKGSVATNSTTRGTTATTSFSVQRNSTFYVVIYKQGTGANSLNLEAVTSASLLSAMAYALTANANGSEYTVSQSITYPAGSGATAQYTNTYASTETHFAIHSSNITAFSAGKVIDLPFQASLPQSNYWVAVGNATTITNPFVTTGFINWVASLANLYGTSGFNSGLGYPGAAVDASLALAIGGMLMTTNAVGTLASFPLTGVISTGGNPMLMFELARFA